MNVSVFSWQQLIVLYHARLPNIYRHVEIISLLCGVTEEVCSTVLLEKPHAQYELVSFNISEFVSLFVPSINDTLKVGALHEICLKLILLLS